jgi:hypothetical protein
MYAEAVNEISGPTGEAQDALRRVRQRAFPSSVWDEKVDAYINDVAASKESFFEAIVNERAWEFGGEMIRKYELIRWGNYSEKMGTMVDELKVMADEAFAGTGDLPDYFFWKLNESGHFTLKNPNRKIPLSQHTALEDAGWTRSDFLLYMHDDALTYKEWITKDWARYTGGTVRYIFPIPAGEIALGVLKNDGYGFTE